MRIILLSKGLNDPVVTALGDDYVVKAMLFRGASAKDHLALRILEILIWEILVLEIRILKILIWEILIWEILPMYVCMSVFIV